MLRKVVVLAASLVLVGTAAAQTEQAIRDQLFGAVDASKNAADTAKANMLAPAAYADALKIYTSAGDELAKGKDMDKVREETAEAKTLFDKATETAKLAEVTFADALTARAAAEKAEAAKYEKRDWENAEEKLLQAATQLEGGNMNRARDTAQEALEDYREVEADSINARAKAGK
jgi:hypothetical protein